MQTIVKIPRTIFEQALLDLQRPHPFAFERVGFFSTKCTATSSLVLVHCIDYHTIADEDYVKDDSIGARIGPNAITAAMTRSAVNRVGQIHVHAHLETPGLPGPSLIDRYELPPLARSLANANPEAAHGWMILSDSDAWSELSINHQVITEFPPPVSIVGFPTSVNRRFVPPEPRKKRGLLFRTRNQKKSLERYSRQGFLGAKADAIIDQTVVGIIGLGGGGSHIGQQLSHLGLRRFVLCDHDRISESNLNRLVGATVRDVEKSELKTNIAERNIRNLHKNAEIINCPKKWEDCFNDLIGCDLIVGCLDSFSARRDLEGFCRRNLIPLIDVGMDVVDENGSYEIYGQVILSMPGKPCMHCMGFLNAEMLGLEAQKYGVAGENPQVVWSNGILCSTAVGIVVDLLTDWSKQLRDTMFISFKGSVFSLKQDSRIPFPSDHHCQHYAFTEVGDPTFISL